MRITVDDQQLILAFSYERVPAPAWSKYQAKGSDGQPLGRRVTTVRVYQDPGKGIKLEDMDPLAEARVVQYAKDQDCKEVARTEALKRLFVHDSQLARKHRRPRLFTARQSGYIWSAYESRYPTIPWEQVKDELGLS